MIAGVEGKSQTRQMAELLLVVFFTVVSMLVKMIAQAQIGKSSLHLLKRIVA